MLSCATLLVSPAVVPLQPHLRALQSPRRPSLRSLSPDVVSPKAWSFPTTHRGCGSFHRFGRNGDLTCRGFPKTDEEKILQEGGAAGEGGSGSGGEGSDWTSSALLLLMWGGLMYYLFTLAPDQTPSRDLYFVQKLLNLKADDGFRMNGVLVPLWYIMGLWPLVYSMLLLPSGRSTKGGIPVWPFLVLSCGAGVYGLLPYFVLWRPPPPPIEETELQRWPLNLLESKLTAGVVFLAGMGLVISAASAGVADWMEFYQYFRESKFIHATSIDFTLLSVFAPFWVYNDITARKWYEKGSWLIPLSLVPFLGPALYLILRPAPPVKTSTVAPDSVNTE
ncbi:hypothetical protein MLD38_026478 [Melastoma candidum]|uniref:Uncharacterized protein n=1 Tax=Melastoma candidum TaxID=119954 RepID=A0ACB9NZR7_9MYRT|nr:hypothetical protein MLD38_026478 [Melastoma candidum]